MENTAHALFGAWEAYYLILGGSAAALTGLQFVVIALLADTPGIRSEDSVGAFATPTVVHFCFCLFVSAVLSAPWPGLMPATWLLAAAGGVGVLYVLIAFRRARRQHDYRPVAEDWLWHTALPLIAYGALFASAMCLPRKPVTALFLVGAVALLLIFIGIHNAWDAVAYIAMQRRSKPRE
jgi:hypothetical protein